MECEAPTTSAGEVSPGRGDVKQIYPFVALIVLLAGGTFFFSNFQVTTDQPGGPQLRPRDNPAAGAPGGVGLPFGLGQQSPPAANPAGTWNAPPPPNSLPGWGQPANPPARVPANQPVSVPGRQTLGGDVIRIATFNIQVFGEQKVSKPEVVKVLADIVRHFDIVAVQEIRDERQSLLVNFVQTINAQGLRFDYVIGPRLGRTTSKEQYAYIFNTDTIEVDRRTLYTVSDPDDLLHREPFVASFRCRRADPSLAFTFTMATIHTDPTPQDLRQELAVLDQVFLSIRNDPRGEDDIILLGDFNASYRQLSETLRLPNVAYAISTNLPTNTTHKSQYDNLLFDRTATQEFLGRSGVFDFVREYNLSLAQAKMVSDHLPVWAEFSVYEGGVPGRVATRPPAYADPQFNQRYAPAPAYEPPLDDRYAPQYSARNPGDSYNYPARNPLPPRQGRW